MTEERRAGEQQKRGESDAERGGPEQDPDRDAAGQRLSLDHGLGGPNRRDGIRMTMDQLPDSVFTPNDARHPERHGRKIVSSTDLRSESLDLHDACKIGGDEPRHVVEARDFPS